MVSSRLREVIERVDPDAAEFFPAAAYYPSGKPYDPPHHMFNVSREIDALDLAKSTLRIEKKRDWTVYDVVGYHDL
jgi:hypothetical protein